MNRSKLPSAEELNARAAEAIRAEQAGREHEAVQLWNQLRELAPDYPPALDAIGKRAFRTGDLQAAYAAFKRNTDNNPYDLQSWINLALVCQGMQDEAGEELAIQRILTIDAMDLLGLILRANLRERQGKTHQAAAAYGAVATVAPPLERLAPDLRPAVMHALSYRQKYDQDFGAFMDQYLETHYQTFSGEKLERFRDSVDIMVGRKRRYESQSMLYHYPRLTPVEFFERADFPWLDAFEAQVDGIREEFQTVLGSEEGFVPYITYPDDVPLNQWAELNNSPKWSALHLYKSGEVVAENAAKCPLTMSLLEGAPQPLQAGRTPAAMFSLLKPKTHIPPHTGVSNVRLVTHLPLIIPEGCGFRVGNQTRQWHSGKAWVFDDTIEHEAWNDSDKLRVVLIFDIWHPQLTQTERSMISAMAAGMNMFRGEAGGFDL